MMVMMIMRLKVLEVGRAHLVSRFFDENIMQRSGYVVVGICDLWLRGVIARNCRTFD
jgi:hypothetical protein